MGTKLTPGRFDCYAKAEPDEPLFTLLARDKEAPGLVEQWALSLRNEVHAGRKPLSDLIQADEAFACARAMRAWRAANRAEPTTTIEVPGTTTAAEMKAQYRPRRQPAEIEFAPDQRDARIKDLEAELAAFRAARQVDEECLDHQAQRGKRDEIIIAVLTEKVAELQSDLFQERAHTQDLEQRLGREGE